MGSERSQSRSGGYMTRGAMVLAVLVLAAVMIVPNFNAREIQQVLIYLPGIDKAVHYCEHIGIVLGTYWMLGFTRLRGSGRRLVIAVCVSLVFSLLDETQQRYMSGRSFEIADLGANLLGAITAAAWLGRRRIGGGAVVLVALLCASLAGGLVYDSYRQQKPYYQGREYQRNQQYQLAKEMYLQAIKAGNSSAGLYNDLAWLEVELLGGDPAVALPFAEHALQRKPHNAGVMDTYGWILYLLGRYNEALDFIDKAYRQDPTIFCIDYHLGMVHLARGDLEKARFHLQKQVIRSPDDRYGRQSRDALTTLGT